MSTFEMAKRRAVAQLTHDNWEEEDVKEQPGQFKRADPEEMKRRIIRVGRRCLDTPTASPVTPASPFTKMSFGSNLNGSPSDASRTTDPGFLGRLKCLNECILRWMKQHMEENPYCDFTPVFDDYQKHLRDMRQKYHGSTGSNSPKTPEGNNGFTPKVTTTTESQEMPKFSFGLQNSAAKDDAASRVGPCTVTFPTSCGGAAPATPSSTEDEPYVPPKNEFTAVQEEGAVYDKRCKLFYKKDNAYVDRGVGTVYVKPVDGKHQLIMRADTNLGNILLNILLVPGLPVSRLGNRDVALVCVPNPPIPNCEGPTTFLLRVKTGQDADQLAETLNNFKK